jgi:hypothetical protein
LGDQEGLAGRKTQRLDVDDFREAVPKKTRSLGDSMGTTSVTFVCERRDRRSGTGFVGTSSR